MKKLINRFFHQQAITCSIRFLVKCGEIGSYMGACREYAIVFMNYGVNNFVVSINPISTGGWIPPASFSRKGEKIMSKFC